ncbi:MAG TPA: NADH-quinone oxidoreductase subunit J [Rickettsiales bacterium]|nr:NADH-quinone oxidoreductase subunit J [Rickettsiales bacterium]
MSFTLILFYLFSLVLLSSAIIVISTRNMVHSVMFLILAFLNAAALFVLLGAEFLAMLLVIVYVGAIAVLFLFVVMMLNVDSKEIKTKLSKYTPLLVCVILVLFIEIFLIIRLSSIGNYAQISLYQIAQDVPNTKAIGNILYTNFFLPFQLAGAVLFVAMIGAIILTLRQKDRFIRKQKISDQIFRNKGNSLEIVKVKSGDGIEI